MHLPVDELSTIVEYAGKCAGVNPGSVVKVDGMEAICTPYWDVKEPTELLARGQLYEVLSGAVGVEYTPRQVLENLVSVALFPKIGNSETAIGFLGRFAELLVHENKFLDKFADKFISLLNKDQEGEKGVLAEKGIFGKINHPMNAKIKAFLGSQKTLRNLIILKNETQMWYAEREWDKNSKNFNQEKYAMEGKAAEKLLSVLNVAIIEAEDAFFELSSVDENNKVVVEEEEEDKKKVRRSNKTVIVRPPPLKEHENEEDSSDEEFPLLLKKPLVNIDGTVSREQKKPKMKIFDANFDIDELSINDSVDIEVDTSVKSTFSLNDVMKNIGGKSGVDESIRRMSIDESIRRKDVSSSMSVSKRKKPSIFDFSRSQTSVFDNPMPIFDTLSKSASLLLENQKNPLVSEIKVQQKIPMGKPVFGFKPPTGILHKFFLISTFFL